MKKIFTFLIIGSTSLLFSCGDDDVVTEDELIVDPIVGFWELDDVSLDVVESDFEYLEYTGVNNFVGESIYTFQFNSDLTFERILEDVTFADGNIYDIEEVGDWEVDGDELDLDLDGDELVGLGYRFSSLELDETTLVMEFEDESAAFSQTKITEWFNDGTLDEEGFFTVTEDEYDSLVTNFAANINLVYSFEFDKEL